ncbi:MAG: type IV pilus modification protein PilV [Pirellulaceae bacterium]|jgi:type IV pilus assembly protein PilV|nr:type IV pilus modification protein PilV [Pirellulaceae bacterium]
MRCEIPRRPVIAATAARGFTLVEVLVALVVLSVGMLGIAALYLEGLRASRDALVRTQAISLAADMADRIRSNRYIAVGANRYDPALVTATQYAACETTGSTCTPAQMYANDLYRWQSAIQNQLPAGSGQVGFAIVNSQPTYTITVTWTQPGDPNNASYSLVVQT